jgi:hypothetical protein
LKKRKRFWAGTFRTKHRNCRHRWAGDCGRLHPAILHVQGLRPGVLERGQGSLFLLLRYSPPRGLLSAAKRTSLVATLSVDRGYGGYLSGRTNISRCSGRIEPA